MPGERKFNRDGQDGQDRKRVKDLKFEISNHGFAFLSSILLILSIFVNFP
jgi:hypothetical protein